MWTDSDAYSQNGYTGSAYVSAKAGQTNLYGMFGLNSDPQTDKNYGSIDYAWYPAANGVLYIYENGAQIGSYGGYATSDQLSIVYDGTNVVYKVNGVVKRSVAATAGQTFYFDSSFYNSGFKLNAIRFAQTEPKGTAIAYDAAGNRRQTTTYVNGVPLTEDYTYDANSRLTATAKSGNTTSLHSYDAAGQLVEQTSYSSPGVISERRTSSYNANGQLTEQNVFNGSGTKTQRTVYTGYDGVGNLTSYQVQVLTGTAYTNYYSTIYAKYDSYKESVVYGSSSYFQPGNTTTRYDANGNILGVSESFKTSKNRTFVTDQSGTILQKTENGKTQNYFYAGDKPLGSSGALDAADFDYNYTPISEQYPATTPGGYVVSAGDTLRGIALALFGDAQLWYLIADANGLQSDADLQVGQNLTIPNKVTNLRNAADTFKPYAPGEIIGDTAPTLPDPPPPPKPKKKGGKCGGIGGIIVAIVATIFTAGALAGVAAQGFAASFGALTGAMGAGGIGLSGLAIAGAVGSVASQAVGMALGVQDKFSWGAVAVAAVSTGLTYGVGQGGIAGQMGVVGDFSRAVVNGAVNNTITQGVSIAVGLQEKFSWQSVAASAVAAGVAYGVGQAVGPVLGKEFGGKLATSTVSGFAGGMVANALRGGSANAAQIAMDAFGNALGNSIVGAMGAPSSAPTNAPNNAYSYEATYSGDPSAADFVGPPAPTAYSPRFGELGSGTFGLDGVAPGSGFMLVDPNQSLPQTGVVGREGAQGAWGIAKSLAGSGASNAEINRIKNQLLEVNPELATGVRQGQSYVVPNADTLENIALARAADRAYQIDRDARAAQAASNAYGGSDVADITVGQCTPGNLLGKSPEQILNARPSLTPTLDWVNSGGLLSAGQASAVPSHAPEMKAWDGKPLVNYLDPTDGRRPFEIPDGNYGLGIYAGLGGEIEVAFENGRFEGMKLALGGGYGGHINLATKTLSTEATKGLLGGIKGDLDQFGDKQLPGDYRIGPSLSIGLGVGTLGIEGSAAAGLYSNSNGNKGGFFEVKPSLTWAPVIPKLQAEAKVNLFEFSYKRHEAKQ